MRRRCSSARPPSPASLARWSCRRAGERLRGGSVAAGDEARAELESLVAEHQALWALRSRPGGLEDSVRKLEKPLHMTDAAEAGARTSGNF